MPYKDQLLAVNSRAAQAFSRTASARHRHSNSSHRRISVDEGTSGCRKPNSHGRETWRVTRAHQGQLAWRPNIRSGGRVKAARSAPAGLGLDAAGAEDKRVIRPGGALIVSTSNAYKGSGGQIVRGEIGPDGSVHSRISARHVSEVASTIQAAGFVDLQLRDMKTEWLVMARREI